MTTFNRRTGGWLLLTLVFCIIACLFFAGASWAGPPVKQDTYQTASEYKAPFNFDADAPVIDIESVAITSADPIIETPVLHRPPPGSPQRCGQLARLIGTRDAEHRYQCQVS